MSTSVIARLVAKELYINRRMMLAAITAGAVSLLVSSFNRTAFNIGSILYITTMVAYAVILVMYSVTQERKDKSLLFVLSLPISGHDYLKAKSLGVLLTFLGPWCLLTVGMLMVVWLSGIPDGTLPITFLMSLFMFGNFCIVLAFALSTTSEFALVGIIIVTNMSITFFIFLVTGLPELAPLTQQDEVTWPPTALTVLAIQVGVIALALVAPFVIRRRKRDFI